MSARRKSGRAAGTRRAQTEPAQVARARRARTVPIDAEALFDVVREPLLVLDAEFRVQRANSAFCQTFETAAADMEGRLLVEADHAAWNVPELRRFLEHALVDSSPGEPLELRHTFERIGRRVLRIGVRCSPARGHDQVLLAIDDLTERELIRAGEQRAVEQLQQAAALIESSDEAIIGKALDGTITSWNRGAQEVYGYSADEAIGRSITLICPGDRIDEIERIMEQIRRGEPVPTFDTRRVRKDGREIDVSVTVSPVLDGAGRVVGASAIGRDISRRMQAERALRASEQHIRDVLDNLFTFVGVLTPDGTLTEANRAPLQAAGITIEDVRGRKFWDCPWWSYSPVVQMRVQAACELAAHGTASRYDVPVWMAGGRLTTIDFMIAPLRDAKGRITHLIPSACDITQRKRAEDALKEREDSLRTVLETAADAIITIDSAGTILTFNSAAEKMFGYRADEAVGRNVGLLMPSPYRNEYDAYLAAYRQTGKQRIIGSVRELVGQRKDGSQFPLELAVSEIDHRMQFAGIIRDISERKALQAQLLTIAEQEQRRIGQDLHDDVGQELTALGLLAYTLCEELEERSLPQTELASGIAVRAQRALHKVRMLSRGLMPVEIDREGLMSTLGDLAARTESLHRVDCTFSYDKPVPVNDNRTATHLYRIAQEAVSNALRHGQPHRIRIVLKAEGDLISLEVSDDGIGFPDEQQGEGMGLKTMRYRAELIGGVFQIGPGPEGGTQVICRVPQGRDR